MYSSAAEAPVRMSSLNDSNLVLTMGFHGLCGTTFIEGTFACLATDVIPLSYLSLRLMQDPSVRQWPVLFLLGGGGVRAKFGHARLLANADIKNRRSLIDLTHRICIVEELPDDVRVLQRD